MMKNVFLSAALILLSISAFGQTIEENLFSCPEDFDTYPREVYCEIESYTKRILTNKVAVSTHWIMAKKVTSPDQIVEGLRTFRMTIEQ